MKTIAHSMSSFPNFLSGNSLMWVIDLQPGVFVDTALLDVPSGLSKSGGERIPLKPDTSGDANRTIHRIGRFGGFSEAEKGLGIMVLIFFI